MKKLKLFFTALLLLCCLTATAHDFEVSGIYYNISSSTNKTVQVTYRGSSYDDEYTGSVVIPENVTYDGTTYSVTSIGDWAFDGCTGLTSVVIGNSVTSIETGAFYGCSGLTSIVIPSSVTSIGSYAFEDCKALTSVEIPNSVTSIGERAFDYCYGLTSVVIGNSVTSIGWQAFYGCTGLTSITIPNSVTSIGWQAFDGCTGLTSITIPNSVTSIEDDAFRGCTGLTSVVVDGNNTKYDSRENCNAIIETENNTLILGCKNTVIPNSVTSIGNNAFYKCTGLTSVTIPNSVKSIGKYAFRGCTGLTSVVIGNSVTSIGWQAFYGCTGLTSITIPNSVTSIEGYAFEDCTGLTSVVNFSNLTFNKGSSDYGNVAHYADKVYNAPNGFIDGNFIWLKNEGGMILAGYLGDATEITLPADYNGENYAIGNYAFYDCYGLTSITIPNSVKSIGESAFNGCSGLTSIEIPNSVTSIGSGAFERCTGLTSITIPNSVTSIESGAFERCTGLTSVVVDGNNTRYDSRENCNAIIETETNTLISGCKNTVIPNSVTSIGERAFDYCYGLTSITIPNSVTSIGSGAFCGCTGLTSITIPNSVTSIGSSAFYGCSNLRLVYNNSSLNITAGSTGNGYVAYYANTVILESDDIQGDYVFRTISGLPTLVAYIGNDAEIILPDNYNGGNYAIGVNVFKKNNTITSIVIPNSVTSIGREAFDECTGLTSITIPNSVTSIGDYAFRGCTGLTSVVIGNSVTSIGNEAFSGTAWYNNQPDGVVYAGKALYRYKGTMPSNTSITIKDGTLSITDYAFKGCEGLTSITILNSVTSIGIQAFYGCTGLTSITIPNSVTSIGGGAFCGCYGLTSVVIPNSVTSIGGAAFRDCTGLTSITIPNSVTSIGNNAFYKCTGLTSITIPNSVTSIGSSAFNDCSGLTSITIPNSVTSIGESAFSGCSNLRLVYNNSSLNITAGSTGNGYVAYYANAVILESDDIQGDYIFRTISGLPTLVAYIGNDAEIILPDNYNGGNYAIGVNIFKKNNTITSITIPNSVTSIGDDAFYSCTGLTSITIPNSVTSIGNNAFSGTAWYNNQPDGVVYAGKALYRYKGTMPSNTSITIKDGTLSITDYAFKGCEGLTSITIPNSVTSIGEGAFMGCTGLKTVYNFSNLTFGKGENTNGYVAYYADKVYNAPNGSKEGDFIFGKPNDVNTLIYYLGNTANLVLPADYNGENYVIDSAVFKDNTVITSVTIPNSVTGIGNEAFSGCTNVEKLYLDCAEVGDWFSGVSAIKEVTIGNGVASVGDDAFTGCTNVEKLSLDCAEVGDWFSGVSAMKEVTIGSGVTNVVASAFNGCTGLEKVCINDLAAWCGIDFGSADANPLYYAKNLYLNGALLTELSIPAEIAEVKDYAFYNCNGVTNIDIVDGVESIGNSAFYGCSDLETLYISNTIESIGDYAFAECNNLFDIMVGSKKAITASENIFSSDAYINACLYVPDGRKFAYERATPWYKFYIVEMDFTGIEDVETEGERVKDVYYDLSGRVVEKPTKGMYIINGKKVLVK